jgi:hypothetical protein
MGQSLAVYLCTVLLARANKLFTLAIPSNLLFVWKADEPIFFRPFRGK